MSNMPDHNITNQVLSMSQADRDTLLLRLIGVIGEGKALSPNMRLSSSSFANMLVTRAEHGAILAAELAKKTS